MEVVDVGMHNALTSGWQRLSDDHN